MPPETQRPFVHLNAAMSLDGKIATYTGDSRMSSPEDLKRVHRLRANSDAIMIGLRTLLRDDPKLTVKFFQVTNPSRVIVDSSARTPLGSIVVRTAKDTPTIVAVTSSASKRKIDLLQQKGVRVLTCGKGPQVSLKLLLRRLRSLGIRRLLLEGGGELNWSMLSQGLVDEVSVAIAPKILGGTRATDMVAGTGFARVKDGIRLKLIGATKYGPDLVVKYTVESVGR